MAENQEIKFDKGTVKSTIWNCDDIRLGHAISSFSECVSNSARGSQKDVVRLHFGLKGDYSFHYKQLNRTFDLIGGHHNIMYSKEFDMVVTNKTPEIETFGIQFPRELFIRFTQDANEPLKRFADAMLDGKSVLFTDHWGAVDPSIQQVIQQIIDSRYKGDLQKLFLLSKSIELLVLSAEACHIAESRRDLFIKSKSDKEKLIAARDLVNERITCPPNLSEVARAVGLNEYKLKRGFKETFNTTVFGYLAEQRLQMAWQYLRDTDKSAAEISMELGYATPQHFNNAFKKKFGITPLGVRGGLAN